MTDGTSLTLKETEINVLTKNIFEKYGYDFSEYSNASFKRRLIKIMYNYKMATLQELQHKVLNEAQFFNTFLNEVTVNVTEMFRNPEFYKALKKVVIPELSTYPLIRIWIAGCSTGEEVYSLAILLKEAGLLERSLIYATDINQEVLKNVKAGIFPMHAMKEYTENYINSGGLFDFSDYYVAKYDKALFNEKFKKHLVISPHNLAVDKSFNEFNLILCRNVMIYFNTALHKRVIKLLYDSLSPHGFLALGAKENLSSSQNPNFEFIKQKIWRKIK